MGKYHQRRSGFLKTKKLYVIATEEAKTEKIYFNELLPPRDAAIRIKILENKKHQTRPTEVFKRLVSFVAENRLTAEDELWLVIDRDEWEEAELNEVAEKIKCRANFKLALSNPCFELWLYLHRASNKAFTHRHQLVPALQKILGSYEKGAYDAAQLIKHVDKAIARAEKLDTPRQEPWPKTQGTHVYRLVRKLCDH